jgi:resuscitation-promoting factor RpfB
LAVRATRLRRLRIRRATQAATLAVGMLVAAGTLFTFAHTNVTLVVNGRPEAVSTMGGNVRDLLEGQGITLTSADLVQPPPATSLADGMTVVVSSDPSAVRPATFGATASDPTGWTPPGSDAAIAAALRSPSVGVWVVEGTGGSQRMLSAQLAEERSSATSIGHPSVVAVRAVVMGKVHDVLTNAATAGELLSAMGINPGADDRVLPPAQTPLHVGSQVTYDQVRIVTRQIQAPVPFETHTSYSSTLPTGMERVDRAGVTGLAERTVRMRIVNGVVVAEQLLSQTLLRAPVSKQVTVGRTPRGGSQVGDATWYDPPWSGYTAAHKTLPFGTHVTVTNLDTGASVTVVIDDRGPYASGRIIDLSPEAFAVIAPLGDGVAHVRITW